MEFLHEKNLIWLACTVPDYNSTRSNRSLKLYHVTTPPEYSSPRTSLPYYNSTRLELYQITTLPEHNSPAIDTSPRVKQGNLFFTERLRSPYDIDRRIPYRRVTLFYPGSIYIAGESYLALLLCKINFLHILTRVIFFRFLLYREVLKL